MENTATIPLRKYELYRQLEQEFEKLFEKRWKERTSDFDLDEIKVLHEKILILEQKNIQKENLIRAYQEMEIEYRKMKNRNWFQRLFNL
jgi:hypothetical protein